MRQESVAQRLRRLRKLRGVTQLFLADHAGVSASLLQKVEIGQVPASPAFVAAVARVLQVSPGYLYGTEAQQVEDQPMAETAGISALRKALDAYDDPQVEGDPLPLAFIDSRLTELAGQVVRLKYGDAATELAGILQHLYIHAHGPDPDGLIAKAALHDAYRLTATVAGRFGQPDLAAMASERHIALAPDTGDPVRIAVSAFHRSTRHLRSGDYAAGIRLIERARGEIDDGLEAASGVHVQLDLRASVLAARDGDRDGADEHIQQARRRVEAGGVQETPYRGLDASPTNIATHWVGAAVESADPAASVERATHVEVLDPGRPERVGRYYVDLARAHLLNGDRAQSIEALSRARTVDPVNTRQSPQVRETILALADRDRRTTDTLPELAKWAGVKL
ncbi:MAG TPA: helix-turn-helix transcriptional regulator [Kribbella sp.]|jgi:transcriptional regulator with XRE-family HTH domain